MEKKGTKTVVYNMKGDGEKKERQKEKERKRLKKYNSKKEEFFTIDYIVRACPRIKTTSEPLSEVIRNLLNPLM